MLSNGGLLISTFQKKNPQNNSVGPFHFMPSNFTHQTGCYHYIRVPLYPYTTVSELTTELLNILKSEVSSFLLFYAGVYVLLVQLESLIGWKFVANIGRRPAMHSSDVTFNSPSPLVPFLPRESFSSKINKEITLPFNTNGSKYILILSREINASKRRWETQAVVSVEKNAI
jgi:hypothetical protein